MDYPVNPTDKMIFEASPGIYFQYTAADATWTRLQGYGAQLVLATPVTDGLMTSADFVKLNGLMIPPPKTTMTAEGCVHTFKDGVFGFRSSQNHLIIETELPLVVTDKDGNKVIQNKVWKIHDNTYGINFKVNLPVLLQLLTARGHLTYRNSIGPPGKKGLPGIAGIDNLETGPPGPPGDNGANAPFNGALLQDTTAIVPMDDNRGIVDIYTSQISPDENYLVAVRANLGNPNLCPQSVIPQKVKSKWIVVTDERPPQTKTLPCNTTLAPGICQSGPGCIPVSKAQTVVVQNFCSTRLYYLDMTPIEDVIQAYFENLLTDLKAVKEAMVLEWLQTMIAVFNEQKLAICCAIENCESRQENQATRNFIDSQRIQGAIGHVSIEVEGPGAPDQTDINTNPDVNCPPPVGPLAPCTTLSVDCAKNNTAETSASITLAAGTYNVSLSACCGYSSNVLNEKQYLAGLDDINNINPPYQALFKKLTPYFGVVNLTYQGICPGGSCPVNMTTPGEGQFHTNAEAQTAYKKATFTIEHAGGAISAYFPLQQGYNGAEKIDLCFKLFALPAVGPGTGGGTGPGPFGGSIIGIVEKDVRVGPLGGEMKRGLRQIGSSSCPNPLMELDLNCGININQGAAVTAELPLGDYVAIISNCCCTGLFPTEEGILTGNSGAVALQYQTDNGPVIIHNPDLGSFNDLNQALALYLGNSLMFHHVGGEISIWTTVRNAGGNGGEVKVSITELQCMNLPVPTPVPPPPGPPIPPSPETFDHCGMTLDQLLFYEGGWKAGACCGVLVMAGGIEWIVVQRSIGTDTTCGGGESINSDCISQGKKFGFYPAIAYPTIDGIHFFGKPTGGVQIFREDSVLQQEILFAIAHGAVIKTKGHPKFTVILFPHES